jgi:hypothetical protein
VDVVEVVSVPRSVVAAAAHVAATVAGEQTLVA